MHLPFFMHTFSPMAQDPAGPEDAPLEASAAGGASRREKNAKMSTAATNFFTGVILPSRAC
jgi:hypothetical protein